MSNRREAIVFIPGTFGLVQERNYCLNAIVLQGLLNNTTQFEIRELGDCDIVGAKGRQIEVKFHSGETKMIDLYETYWLDLVTRLSAANLKDKVVRGFDLLFYWTFSKTWQAFREAPMMLGGVLIALVLVALWYYGTLVLALTAIAHDQSIFGAAIPAIWANRFGQWGEAMGGWSIWVAVSLLLTFLPLDLVIDQTDFTKRYLQNEIDPVTGETLRVKIRKRLIETLDSVLDHGEYERVTILAHSFGTLFATELLATAYPFPKPFRYITVAGPLKLLSLRSSWVNGIIQKALRNPAVESWTDYYSDRDLFCTKVPVSGDVPPIFKGRCMLQDIPLRDCITGKSHIAYFAQEEVIDALMK
ncbi:MAG TPA: hypothetical protein V6C88_03930 [Chroococcidiopsis sp.]